MAGFLAVRPSTESSNPSPSSVESSANLTPTREHATEPHSRAVLRMPWRPQVIDVFRALTTAAVALANASAHGELTWRRSTIAPTGMRKSGATELI
jgi:hypothetical protein